jgi:hypothetical protein
MDAFLWLGLTVKEAEAQAEALGLSCAFQDTRDPKQKEDGLVGKVVRVRQHGQQIELVIGYFSPAAC